MIDFDVVTGPGPREKPPEPGAKPRPRSNPDPGDAVARLPRQPAAQNVPGSTGRPAAR